MREIRVFANEYDLAKHQKGYCFYTCSCSVATAESYYGELKQNPRVFSYLKYTDLTNLGYNEYKWYDSTTEEAEYQASCSD